MADYPTTYQPQTAEEQLMQQQMMAQQAGYAEEPESSSAVPKVAGAVGGAIIAGGVGYDMAKKKSSNLKNPTANTAEAKVAEKLGEERPSVALKNAKKSIIDNVTHDKSGKKVVKGLTSKLDKHLENAGNIYAKRNTAELALKAITDTTANKEAFEVASNKLSRLQKRVDTLNETFGIKSGTTDFNKSNFTKILNEKTPISEAIHEHAGKYTSAEVTGKGMQGRPLLKKYVANMKINGVDKDIGGMIKDIDGQIAAAKKTAQFSDPAVVKASHKSRMTLLNGQKGYLEATLGHHEELHGLTGNGREFATIADIPKDIAEGLTSHTKMQVAKNKLEQAASRKTVMSNKPLFEEVVDSTKGKMSLLTENKTAKAIKGVEGKGKIAVIAGVGAVAGAWALNKAFGEDRTPKSNVDRYQAQSQIAGMTPVRS